MSALEQPSAIVHAWQCDSSANALKRLSLLFERVYYIPPTLAVFRAGLSDLEARRREVAPGGPCWIEGFSWWDDIQSDMAVDVRQSRHSGIAEVVTKLEQEGALTPAVLAPHASIPIISDESYSLARTAWMKHELSDHKFLEITGTATDWENQPIDMGVMGIRSPEGDVHPTVWVNPPAAWYTSESLTEISYLAERLDAVPVLVAAAHIRGLSQRFAQIDGMLHGAGAEGMDIDPHAPTDRWRAGLGRCLFVLAGELFDDSTLNLVPVSELVKLRRKTLAARRDLLDQSLRNFHALVMQDMTLEQLESRVRDFVRYDLSPALTEFREEAKRAKEDLFGDLAVRLTEAGSHFALGGLAGGLAATVFGGSLWSLFLAGAFAATTRTVPALARDLRDAYISSRRRQRNGLAIVDAMQRAATKSL